MVSMMNISVLNILEFEVVISIDIKYSCQRRAKCFRADVMLEFKNKGLRCGGGAMAEPCRGTRALLYPTEDILSKGSVEVV